MNKELFEDKEDLLLNKLLLAAAKKEGYNLSETDLVTISDGSKTFNNAEDVSKIIESIIDIKNELFSDVEIGELTDSEYEKILREFDDRIRLNIPTTIVDSIKTKYANINFDNLNERTPNLILTGDVIYDSMSESFGPNWDYSPVIMQWCRAVELELRNKIYSCIDSYQIKEDISNKSTETSYYINGSNRHSSFKKLMVNDMMGFYGAIKKYGMIEYIFNQYIKNNYSNFTLNDFRKIVDYVIVVNNYRDNSAHSISQIDLNKSSADDCKSYIVASKKILEILSHLKIV